MEIQGKYYVFYHRHTNYTNTDRQDCAEEIEIRPDWRIPQVEKTCCGLNGGPLKGEGTCFASICSTLIPKGGNVFYPFFKTGLQKRRKTYITQFGKDSDTKETQYIHNVQDGTILGYKYFDLSEAKEVVLTLQGRGKGSVSLSFFEHGEEKASASFISFKNKKTQVRLPLPSHAKKEALFFTFHMKGKADVFTLSSVS